MNKREAVLMLRDYGPFKKGEVITGVICVEGFTTNYLRIDERMRRGDIVYLDTPNYHGRNLRKAQPNWRKLSPLEQLALAAEDEDGE